MFIKIKINAKIHNEQNLIFKKMKAGYCLMPLHYCARGIVLSKQPNVMCPARPRGVGLCGFTMVCEEIGPHGL